MIAAMIEKFSKRVLLTAGWSRNWGGQLSKEIYSSLIGHPHIRTNAAVRDLLYNEPAFEVALGQTHTPSFERGNREDVEQAILDVFVTMAREIARPDHGPSINIDKVQELLFGFFGRHNDGNSGGYLFALNQDVFLVVKFKQMVPIGSKSFRRISICRRAPNVRSIPLECHLYNEHVTGAPSGALPGRVPRPGQR